MSPGVPQVSVLGPLLSLSFNSDNTKAELQYDNIGDDTVMMATDEDQENINE